MDRVQSHKYLTLIIVDKNSNVTKQILVVKKIDGQDAWTSCLEKFESRDLTRDVISLVSLLVVRTVTLKYLWATEKDRIIEIGCT